MKPIFLIGLPGSGKSTFSKVLAGHPAYSVLNGDIIFKGSTILDLDPEQRSHLGIFLAFQYPIEIPGVSNEDFLRLAYNAKQKFYNKPIDCGENRLIENTQNKETTTGSLIKKTQDHATA